MSSFDGFRLETRLGSGGSTVPFMGGGQLKDLGLERDVNIDLVTCGMPQDTQYSPGG